MQAELRNFDADIFHAASFYHIYGPGGELDLFCAQHAPLGSDAAVQRKMQTQRRLKWAQSVWDDPVKFDAVVISGRYQRLRTLTGAMSACDERAWRRLKTEVLAILTREFLCESDPAHA